MRFKIRGLLIGLLLLSPAAGSAGAADEDGPFVLHGVYRFVSEARGADGKPVCVERWTFGADGIETVESGQEVVRKRFHVEGDRPPKYYLVSTMLETNGKPDCVGQTNPVSDRESRVFFMPMNSGTLMLCPEPAPPVGGNPPLIGNCYGQALPEPATP
ncbi:MAG: hypothetical protein GC145_00315 [Caulobacter sp.]|nr:hypothetical protein [Caulobacter sp.]